MYFLFLVSQLDLGFFILLSVFQLCGTPLFFSSIPFYQQRTSEDRSGRPHIRLFLRFLSTSLFVLVLFLQVNFSSFSSLYKYSVHMLSFSSDAFHPKDVIHLLLFCPRLLDLLVLCLGFAVQSGNGYKKSATAFPFSK